MTSGEKIANIRKEKGYSQLDLALMCGYKTKGAISKIENAGNDVSFKTITKIAKALNVEAQELACWETRKYNTISIFNEENIKAFDRATKDAEMLKKYRQLSEEEQQTILDMIDFMLSKKQ